MSCTNQTNSSPTRDSIFWTLCGRRYDGIHLRYSGMLVVPHARVLLLTRHCNRLQSVGGCHRDTSHGCGSTLRAICSSRTSSVPDRRFCDSWPSLGQSYFSTVSLSNSLCSAASSISLRCSSSGVPALSILFLAYATMLNLAARARDVSLIRVTPCQNISP